MPVEPSEFDREPGLSETTLIEDRYLDQVAEDRVVQEEEAIEAETEPLLSQGGDSMALSTHDTRPWYSRPSPWWIISGLFILATNYGCVFPA